MSAVLQAERPKVTPAPPAPAPVTATVLPANAMPAVAADARSDAWAGDRIALAVWTCGALLMAVLLMKDLIYGILFR
jgi:hypothetical protein